MNLKKIIVRASEKIRENHLHEAKELLTKALKNNSNNSQLLNQLAFVCFKLNDLENAKKFLNNLLMLSFDEHAAKNLLLILINSSDWINSKSLIQKALLYSYDKNEWNKNLAYVEGKLENFDTANKLYNELISTNNMDINLYINYGYLLNLQEKFDQAIKIYNDGIHIDKTNYHLLYNLGTTYKNKNNFKESVEWFKKALAIKDTDYKLWLTMAGSFIEMNEMDKAHDAIENASRLNANNPEIYHQLAIFNQRKGLNDVSIEYLIKALTLDPNHTEANYQLGLIYLKQNKYDEAKNHYKYRVFKQNRQINDFSVNELQKKDDLLAIWEQGIGDTLILMRLARTIKKMVNTLTVVVQDKLYDYMRVNYPEIIFYKNSDLDIIKKNEDIIKKYKKINLASFLRFVNEPAISSSNEMVHKMNQYQIEVYRNQKFKLEKEEKIIGLSWKSSNEKLRNTKSFELMGLKEVLSNKKNYFVNIQYGEIKKEIDEIKSYCQKDIYVDNNLDYFNDIIGLSNLVASCDVVITCSNITAHIAGAINKKTYLLLPKEIGELWYWYNDENYSSWYPSIEIIRQKKIGDWDSVFKMIKEKLD